MQNNEHIFDDKMIQLLTGEKYDSLTPLQYFEHYAKLHGGNLKDNPRYYRPIYPGFDDFNYRHDTSNIHPIYLNDFDYNLEEDRKRLSELIRMDFDSETFDTIAKCQCGALRGNYFVGSNRTCRSCGSKVERLVDANLETKVWLRLPEGVVAFINPGFYKTFFDSIGTQSPKINIVEAIISPTYRRNEGIAKKENGKRLFHELAKIGIELNYNSFITNCDRFMEHFLVGDGRKLTNLSIAASEGMFKLYHKFKDIIFPSYLPVPNRFSTIIERSGSEKFAFSNQLKVSNVYQSIADTKDNSDVYRVTQEDVESNVNIVAKSIIKLAKFNSDNLKELVFQKPSLIRKHVIAGSLPFSGRSIITSICGVHDAGVARIPRIMMIAMLKKFVLSFLYRQGLTPLKAQSLIARAAHTEVPLIHNWIREKQRNKEIVGMLGRNPTIQYLSARCFFLEMNEDFDDESINLPILSVGPMNADFDGDQIYCYLLFDLKAKARSYGAFGHQSMLDANRPFKISRFAGQTSTTLMNINNILRSVPIQ